MTKSNTNRPTHLLYVVDSDNANWTQIGAAWQHKDSDGMNIVIPPGIMISGKLVIRAAKGDATAKN
ncbi:hypothetical protein JQ554_28080 [Bradyrhizobium diazoefficiens]|nr:hypothetical protein [Bradyrhizobium diazoefficiens]MBR0967092.1 hypothetical protein [Bradyrhizobium diazoefficiens]MBR0979092.1 hypothetical protein [Bradyrhizobium diazoefficiens]MBR1010151.1 hypothetical protein [Bradyrhizobium diazoefficiens]MBR1017379.1 hypothetical protein [Bradyrhizobium diazoefficiens]MBR1054849.1 hypothetical protein [Bradyrhizobium diazoefficiens]